MKKILAVLVTLVTLSLSAREFKDMATAQGAQINRVNNDDIALELPKFVFSYTNTKINIRFKNPQHDKLTSNAYQLHFIVNGNDQLVQFDQDGVGSLNCIFKADNKLTVLFEDASMTQELAVISIWYMVLPLVGLFAFLGYRLTFNRKKLKVVSHNTQPETMVRNSSLKIVKEEEEVLA